jgi:hypothetical protein
MGPPIGRRGGIVFIVRMRVEWFLQDLQELLDF